MNKNGFSEIFRCKELASSRAEKARGWFGSSKVSKTVNKFGSKNLDDWLLQRELSRQKKSLLI